MTKGEVKKDLSTLLGLQMTSVFLSTMSVSLTLLQKGFEGIIADR